MHAQEFTFLISFKSVALRTVATAQTLAPKMSAQDSSGRIWIFRLQFC